MNVGDASKEQNYTRRNTRPSQRQPQQQQFPASEMIGDAGSSLTTVEQEVGFSNRTVLSRLILARDFQSATTRLLRHPEEASIWIVSGNKGGGKTDTRLFSRRDSWPSTVSLDKSLSDACSSSAAAADGSNFKAVRQLPLHMACSFLMTINNIPSTGNCSRRVHQDDKNEQQGRAYLDGLIRSLVHSYPEACRQRNHEHQLPLHQVLLDVDPSPEIVVVLIAAHPEAVEQRDRHGRVPSDLILREGHRPVHPRDTNDNEVASLLRRAASALQQARQEVSLRFLCGIPIRSMNGPTGDHCNFTFPLRIASAKVFNTSLMGSRALSNSKLDRLEDQNHQTWDQNARNQVLQLETLVQELYARNDALSDTLLALVRERLDLPTTLMDVASRGSGMCRDRSTHFSDLYELQDANGYLQKRIRDLEVVLRDNGFNVNGDRLEGGSLIQDDREMMSMMGMDPEKPTELTKYMERKIAELHKENETLETKNARLAAKIEELHTMMQSVQIKQSVHERVLEQSRDVSLTIATPDRIPTDFHSTMFRRQDEVHNGDLVAPSVSKPSDESKEKIAVHCEIAEVATRTPETTIEDLRQERDGDRSAISRLKYCSNQLHSIRGSKDASDVQHSETEQNLLVHGETQQNVMADVRTERHIADATAFALENCIGQPDSTAREMTFARTAQEEMNQALLAEIEQQSVIIDALRAEKRERLPDNLSENDRFVEMHHSLSCKCKAEIEAAERLTDRLGPLSATIENLQRQPESADAQRSLKEDHVQELHSVDSILEKGLEAKEIDSVKGSVHVKKNEATPSTTQAVGQKMTETNLGGIQVTFSSGHQPGTCIDVSIQNLDIATSLSRHSRNDSGNGTELEADDSAGRRYLHPPMPQASIPVDEIPRKNYLEADNRESTDKKTGFPTVPEAVTEILGHPNNTEMMEKESSFPDAPVDEVVHFRDRAEDRERSRSGDELGEDEENEDMKSLDMSRTSEVSLDLFAVFNPAEPSELEKKLQKCSERDAKGRPNKENQVRTDSEVKSKCKERRPNGRVEEKSQSGRRGRSPIWVRSSKSGDLHDFRPSIRENEKQRSVRRSRSADTGLEEIASCVAREKLKVTPKIGTYLDLVSQVGSDDLDVIYKRAVNEVDTFCAKTGTCGNMSSIVSSNQLEILASKSTVLNGASAVVSSTIVHRTKSVSTVMKSIIADTEETYGIEVPIAIIDALNQAVCESVQDSSLLSIIQTLHDNRVFAEAENYYGTAFPTDLIQALRTTSLPPGISIEKLVLPCDRRDRAKEAFEPVACSLVDHREHSGILSQSSQYQYDTVIPDTSLHLDNSWGKLTISTDVNAFQEAPTAQADVKSEQQDDSPSTAGISHREKKRRAELTVMNSLADFGGDTDDLKNIFLHAKQMHDRYRTKDEMPQIQPLPSSLTNMKREEDAKSDSLDHYLDSTSYPIMRPNHSESCVLASPQDLELDLLLSAVDENPEFALDFHLDLALRKASRTFDESIDFVAPMNSQPKAQFGKYLSTERLEILFGEAKIFLGDEPPKTVLHVLRNHARRCKSATVDDDVDSIAGNCEIASTSVLGRSAGGHEGILGELYKMAYHESPRVQPSSPPPNQSPPQPPPDFNALASLISQRRGLNTNTSDGKSRIDEQKGIVSSRGLLLPSRTLPVSNRPRDSLVKVTLGDEDELGKLYKTAYDEAPRICNSDCPSPTIKSPPRPEFESSGPKSRTLPLNDFQSPPFKNRTPILSEFLELNRHELLERTQSGREIPLLSPVTEPTMATDGSTIEPISRLMGFRETIPNLDIMRDIAAPSEEGNQSNALWVNEEPSVDTGRELDEIISESQRELGELISVQLVEALRKASSDEADLESTNHSTVLSLLWSIIDDEQDEDFSNGLSLQRLTLRLGKNLSLIADQPLTSSAHQSFGIALRKQLSRSHKRPSNVSSIKWTVKHYLDALIGISEKELGCSIPSAIEEGVRGAVREYCSVAEAVMISWEELERILQDVCEGYDEETWFDMQEAFFKAWELCSKPRRILSQVGNSSGYFSAVSENEESVSVLMDDPDDFDHLQDIIDEIEQVYGDVSEDLVNKLKLGRDKMQGLADLEYSSDLGDSSRSAIFNISGQSLDFGYSQSTFASGFSPPPQRATPSQERMYSSQVSKPADTLDVFLAEIESEYGRALPPDISDALKAVSMSSGLLRFDHDFDVGRAMNESGHLVGLSLLPEIDFVMKRAASKCSQSGSLSCPHSMVSFLSSSPSSVLFDRSGELSLDGPTYNLANSVAGNTMEAETFCDEQDDDHVKDTESLPSQTGSTPPDLPSSSSSRPTPERTLSSHSILSSNSMQSNQSGHSVTVNRNLGPNILKGLKKVYPLEIPSELMFVLKHSVALPYSMNSDEDLSLVLRECESLSGNRLAADLVLALREASATLRTPSNSLRSRRTRLIRQGSGSFRSTSRSSGMPSIMEAEDGKSPPGTKKRMQEYVLGEGMPIPTHTSLRPAIRTDSADPGIPSSDFEEKAGFGGSSSTGIGDAMDDDRSLCLLSVEGSRRERLKPEASTIQRLGFNDSTATQLTSNKLIHPPSSPLRTDLELRTIASSGSTLTCALDALNADSDHSNKSDSTLQSSNKSQHRSLSADSDHSTASDFTLTSTNKSQHRSDSISSLGMAGQSECRDSGLRFNTGEQHTFSRSASLGGADNPLFDLGTDDLATIFKIAARRMSQ